MTLFDLAYAGGDRPRELLDDVSLVNMAFHDDPHYFGLNGHNSSVEWNSLLPTGDGIVFMGDNGTPYDVSMWHQVSVEARHDNAHLTSRP